MQFQVPYYMDKFLKRVQLSKIKLKKNYGLAKSLISFSLSKPRCNFVPFSSAFRALLVHAVFLTRKQLKLTDHTPSNYKLV